MIRCFKRDGVAVLPSSHLLEQVQSICDRVALFQTGRIALMGTVPELARQVLGGGYHVEVEASGEGLSDKLAAVPGGRMQDGRPEEDVGDQVDAVERAARDIRLVEVLEGVDLVRDEQGDEADPEHAERGCPGAGVVSRPIATPISSRSATG